MAAQTQVTSLTQLLGARVATAQAEARDRPVEYGNAKLPDGIENGVAQLTFLGFDLHKDGDNKGKPFFRAAGTVVEPREHNGVGVAGQQTSWFIPMYDTPKRKSKKRFEDHWADYLNLFKQFAVDMPPPIQQGEDGMVFGRRTELYFQQVAVQLVAQGPYFRFRTWKGKASKDFPNPQTNEEWQGITQYAATPIDPATNGVQMAPPSTQLGPAPFTEPPMGRPEYQQPTGVVTPASAPVAGAPANIAVGSQTLPPAADVVAALVEIADADPEGQTDDAKDAQRRLTAMAQQTLTDAEIGALPNWAAVMAAAAAKTGGAVTPTRPTGAPAADPVKGATVSYRGVPGHEVTSVNPVERVVTLKGPDKRIVVGADKKLLKIPFAELM